ncbi:MAG: RagB/SusD family nutrient uptake outer membrane protein [Sphingobacteriales bacterium]|nr:RagB/SusD family nutrient uptake outer membrane protein [Sphingobacteriales bacterium]
MKKKYIYGLMFATFLASGLVSCDKQLNIQPTQSIDQSKALLTSGDVMVALNGAYSALGSADLYGGRVFLEADFLGDNGYIDWSGTYQGLTQIINKAIPANNGFVNSVWADGYSTINDVNNVLANLDKVNVTSRDAVEGQAKFIRGAVYFDLVRMFGKAYNDGDPTTNLGVPLVLTPTQGVDASNNVSRATVAAVYTQAITDLKDAEAKLPASNGFFASKYAAAAMLSRVYLQMGDYTNAATEANTVIESGKFSLTADYVDAFPLKGFSAGGNTSEDIFAMQVTTQTGFNGFNEFYDSGDYAGRGDAAITDAWVNTYESGDQRLNTYFVSGGSNFIGKFSNPYGNVSIIRLAEMYLTRAEANLRLGGVPIGGVTPTDDLTTIRTRVGLAPVIATLPIILNERAHELAFEGFFLHDAKRTQTNIGNIAWNDNKLVFPIPQREMDANPNLVQNPGY